MQPLHLGCIYRTFNQDCTPGFIIILLIWNYINESVETFAYNGTRSSNSPGEGEEIDEKKLIFLSREEKQKLKSTYFAE